MADKSIERVENLIRVVSNTLDEHFNLWSWCDCAIGHAMTDDYFVNEGVELLFGHGIRTGRAMGEVAKFFDIGVDRAIAIFVPNLNSGYGTRKQVLTALRVLLLEKMAQREEWGGLTKERDWSTPHIEELVDV